MRRMRFPIAVLMLVILIAAVGLAALSAPSELWAAGLFSLAILALLGSALGAIGGRDDWPAPASLYSAQPIS